MYTLDSLVNIITGKIQTKMELVWKEVEQSTSGVLVLPVYSGGEVVSVMNTLFSDNSMKGTSFGCAGTITYPLNSVLKIHAVVDILYSNATGRMVVKPTRFAYRNNEGLYQLADTWYAITQIAMKDAAITMQEAIA